MLFFWRRHPDLNRGIKVLQTLALPLGYDAANFYASFTPRAAHGEKNFFNKIDADFSDGAGNETRTRDIHLGKVTLYH